MKRLNISAVLTCAILTACGGGSGSSDPGPVTIQTTPEISVGNPLVLEETDFVSVTRASVDFFRAVDNSCSNPSDAQYLSLSANFEQKSILCVEFTTTIQSERGFTLNYAMDYPGTEFDTSSDFTDDRTPETDGAVQPVTVTSVTSAFLNQELLGSLPQNISVTLGLYDIEGNVVDLSSETLQLTGSLSSTENTSPDGTDISISYAESGVFVNTRYRDLPTDGNFCVDHDRMIVDQATGLVSLEHVVAARLIPTTNGNYHAALVRLDSAIAPGAYLARVFLGSDDGESCFVDGEQAAPAIEYDIKG